MINCTINSLSQRILQLLAVCTIGFSASHGLAKSSDPIHTFAGGDPIVVPTFDRRNDLLIAQYDNCLDVDDYHAQAAFASMLRHPEFIDLRYFATYGAIGEQKGTNWGIVNGDPVFFGHAFGVENVHWTNAVEDWDGSVQRLKHLAKRVLESGHRVWVAEGGQADITHDWVKALLNEQFPKEVIKSNVYVVQHSWWNQQMTTDAKLEFLIDHTTYLGPTFRNSGDKQLRDYANEYRVIKNGNPPLHSYLLSFKERAVSPDNPNQAARELWTAADRGAHKAQAKKIKDRGGIEGTNPHIRAHGVDFSDTIEIAYILDMDDIYYFEETGDPEYDKDGEVHIFWERFVTNDPQLGR